MPPNTEEQLHYHNRPQQFFYILSGMATFEINGVLHQLEENKGICIEAKTKHRILNKGDKDLEFILVSEPKSHADRVNIEENGGKHQYFAETLEWQHFFPTAFGNLNL